MLNSILVIARARFLILRNTLWRGNLRRKIAWIVLTVAVCLGAFGIYSLLGVAVRAITGPAFAEILAEAAKEAPELNIPTDLRVYILALPSVVLLGALVLLVLTSFSTVLSSLYLSGDIDMLLVAPVPMRAVFIVKFFGALILPYLLLFVLLFPALVGLGQGLGFGLAYYLALIVVLLLLPLLPLSIGALLVMLVVRVIPAQRAREIVGVIGGMIGISWYIFSQFSRQFASNIGGAQALGLFERAANPLLPSSWAGRALILLGEKAWGPGLAYLGLFSIASIGLFAVALLLAERVYYDGWSNMAAQSGRVRTHRAECTPGQRVGGFSLLNLLPSESAAIVYKDLRVFPRDLRNVQQLIFPLVIAGIWVFNLLNGNVQDITNAGAPDTVMTLLFPAGITMFVCLSLSTAIGGPTISREGKGFWQLKIAPISSQRMLLGKLVLAYAPFPLVGTVLIALIAVLQRTNPLSALLAWALVMISGLGISAIALGFGALFPRFDWERPAQQQTLQSGCLTPIFYFIYVLLVSALAVGMPLLGTFFPAWTLVLGIFGWLLAIGLTAFVTWLFLMLGASRLDKIEV